MLSVEWFLLTVGGAIYAAVRINSLGNQLARLSWNDQATREHLAAVTRANGVMRAASRDWLDGVISDDDFAAALTAWSAATLEKPAKTRY